MIQATLESKHPKKSRIFGKTKHLNSKIKSMTSKKDNRTDGEILRYQNDALVVQKEYGDLANALGQEIDAEPDMLKKTLLHKEGFMKLRQQASRDKKHCVQGYRNNFKKNHAHRKNKR
jgi:hypothetical protein